MFCIVLADCPHGSYKCSACKRTFLKPGLRVEKSENTALAFLYGRRIRILCVSMTPSPHPLTSSLRPLSPVTSHNNNNNNNSGGLHACVHATEDIEPTGVTRAERKRIMDNRIAIFAFFLFCSVSPSTVCLYTVHKLYAHALSLLLLWKKTEKTICLWCTGLVGTQNKIRNLKIRRNMSPLKHLNRTFLLVLYIVPTCFCLAWFCFSFGLIPPCMLPAHILLHTCNSLAWQVATHLPNPLTWIPPIQIETGEEVWH